MHFSNMNHAVHTKRLMYLIWAEGYLAANSGHCTKQGILTIEKSTHLTILCKESLIFFAISPINSIISISMNEVHMANPIRGPWRQHYSDVCVSVQSSPIETEKRHWLGVCYQVTWPYRGFSPAGSDRQVFPRGALSDWVSRAAA